MSATTPAGAQPYYFVPAPSRHPASVAFGFLLIVFGASQWVNGAHWGSWVVLAGFAVWVFVMQQWFRQAISESEAGEADPHSPVVAVDPLARAEDDEQHPERRRRRMARRRGDEVVGLSARRGHCRHVMVSCQFRNRLGPLTQRCRF